MAAPSHPEPPIVEVRGLAVTYHSAGSGGVDALTDVDFSIARGEAVGLVGESGCGKSTLGMALLRCLPASARMTGSVFYRGRDLASLNEREMRKIRGAGIAMVFQDPMLALNPVMRAGDQVVEVLRAHLDSSAKAAKAAVLDSFARLGFEEPERIYRSYPHQLSGGQCQRVAIAQALACKPDLIVADEPTASLDPETALEIVNLLRRISQDHTIALVLIAHDAAVVRALADRVLVLHEGRIVEQGSAEKVLVHPTHFQTQQLVAAANGFFPAPQQPHSEPRAATHARHS